MLPFSHLLPSDLFLKYLFLLLLLFLVLTEHLGPEPALFLLLGLCVHR